MDFCKSGGIDRLQSGRLRLGLRSSQQLLALVTILWRGVHSTESQLVQKVCLSVCTCPGVKRVVA